MMTKEEAHWKLFALASGIYLKSRRLAEESLKPLNMTFPQFGALLSLSQGDGITQRELAERMEADTTTTMVLCDSLGRRGWLNRVKDPSDRRVNRLMMTEEGREALARAHPLMLSRYEFFTRGITEEEIEAVLPVLDKLHEFISQHYRGEIKS